MDDHKMVSAEEAREIQQTAECLGPGAEILARLARTVVALHTDVANRDARIAALTEALRAVLDLAPEGGTPWVAAMARAQRVLDGGAR